MKPSTTTALAFVLGVISVPAIAQYGGGTTRQAVEPRRPQQQEQQQAQPAKDEGKIQPSKKALKALIDLQTAVNKADYANLPALVAAAQAVASTKEDHYLIGQLQIKAALASKDNVMLASGVDAVATSGYIDQAKSAELYASLASTLYNAKQYAAAQAAYQKAIAVDPHNTNALGMLGETYFAQGQKAEAIAAFQRAIQASVAAGQKPDQNLLKRAVSMAYESQSPAAVELSRQWVAAYPSADSWHNAIAIYRNLNRPDVEGTLDLLRLMHATNSLTSGSDYSLYSRAAAEQLNYNEAKTAIEAGIAAKLVNPADPDVRDIVNGLKAKQIATAADLEVATKSARDGMALLRIGDRYYGMGNYAKAADLYRMASGKPGVDPAVASLHLGMALARSGDKAGATAAFKAVSGGRADIAAYWLAYLGQAA
jgi:tetratricopeptide (TPR) repeat protein